MWFDCGHEVVGVQNRRDSRKRARFGPKQKKVRKERSAMHGRSRDKKRKRKRCQGRTVEQIEAEARKRSEQVRAELLWSVLAQ